MNGVIFHLPCRQKVTKQNQNFGRQFYCCAKRRQDGGCTHFQWFDSNASSTKVQPQPTRQSAWPTPAPNPTDSSTILPPPKRTRSTGPRKCSNCRQPGHTRLKCPSLAS
ncbi:DNA topoisomerase 3-alpha [Cichlidogyrus casuarinus]|uniref:DNA topoisomerase 3-alpha n=1 Tax=Cichlidogyrus casuarinus TaxID=1844966 RepID=A0ABD2QJ70_9PLAT